MHHVFQGAFDRLDPTGAFLEQSVKDTPVGRCGEMEEIANLSSYLVSDYASYMNGSVSIPTPVTASLHRTMARNETTTISPRCAGLCPKNPRELTFQTFDIILCVMGVQRVLKSFQGKL